jgi:hypothetical protein
MHTQHVLKASEQERRVGVGVFGEQVQGKGIWNVYILYYILYYRFKGRASGMCTG